MVEKNLLDCHATDYGNNHRQVGRLSDRSGMKGMRLVNPGLLPA